MLAKVWSHGTLVALLGMFVLVIAACAPEEDTAEPIGDEPVDEEPADEEPVDEEEPVEEEPAAVDEGPFTIGVSNGFVGSEWRTQMIEDIESVFAEYEEQGLVDNLIIESADVDVSGQIQQIRNLIGAGVDAIIINPNSPTALNAAIEEAAAQDILVVATDQAVETEQALNVVIDQRRWGAINAEWLAGQLGEGAGIVAINGIAGHPANEVRWEGASEVFEEAGIEVLTETNADWDQATGQTVMSDLLATYPEIDGVFTQDGMAEGVLRALIAAGDQFDVQNTGEARAGYLRLWEDQLEENEDFESVGVVNPPGVAGTALRVAVYRLQGYELSADALEDDGHTVYQPIAEPYTNDNLDEAIAEIEGQADAYVLDAMLSDEEVRAWFEGLD